MTVRDDIEARVMAAEEGKSVAIRKVNVRRDGPDSWSVWAKGQCLCGAPLYIAMTTERTIAHIVAIATAAT